MPRGRRIQLCGAWYHVFNRGVDRQKIFLSPGDYHKFLSLLIEACEIYGSEIHAYCLMGNHYHFLLYTLEANIAKIMHHLGSKYTRYFNLLHSRDGPLFKGRYNAVLVDDDYYQLYVSRYIHRNPLEAGIVPDLNRYPWSSYCVYNGSQASTKWLHTDVLLAHFAQCQYLLNFDSYPDFVETESLDDVEIYCSDRFTRPIMDSSKFFQTIYKNIALPRKAQYEAFVARVKNKPTIEEVILGCCDYYHLNKLVLLSTTTGQMNIPRLKCLILCKYHYAYTYKEIANVFKATPRSLSSTVVRYKNKYPGKLTVDTNLIDSINLLKLSTA